jgi:hypothetical protein
MPYGPPQAARARTAHTTNAIEIARPEIAAIDAAMERCREKAKGCSCRIFEHTNVPKI